MKTKIREAMLGLKKRSLGELKITMVKNRTIGEMSIDEFQSLVEANGYQVTLESNSRVMVPTCTEK